MAEIDIFGLPTNGWLKGASLVGGSDRKAQEEPRGTLVVAGDRVSFSRVMEAYGDKLASWQLAGFS